MVKILHAVVIVGLLNLTGWSAGPATAAGADKILYDSGGHLFLMNPDGSGNTDLMTGWSGFASNPSLSPDGTRIAFTHTPSPAQPDKQEIYTMPAAPTAQAAATRLTTNAVLDDDAAWSPDGTRIVFTRDVVTASDPRNYEIFTMGADGSSPVRLTHDSVGNYDFEPAWSPDGTKIAYATGKDGYGCDDEADQLFLGFDQIHVMSSSGGGDTNVLQRDDMVAAAPDWSPDGSTLLFYADLYTLGPDTGNGPTCQGSTGDHVYAMPATGSTGPADLHAGDFPTWSPDGNRIAFQQGISQALTVMAANGSGAVPLNRSGRFPDWGTVAAGRIATTTTVSVTTGTKLKAVGAVSPDRAGQSVRVTLYRRSSGAFKKISTTTSTLTRTSHYVARFARPRSGTCKVTTTYPGDARYLPSKRSVRHAC